MKLTPDQLHRLIDEVAELADFRNSPTAYGIALRCERAGCLNWWAIGAVEFAKHGRGFAGLSAVLILLSKGG